MLSGKVMMLETDEQLGMEVGAQITTSFIKLSQDGVAEALISNSHSLTHRIPEGTDLGQAAPVEVVEPEEPTGEQPHVNSVSDGTTETESGKLLITLFQDKLQGVPEHGRTQLVTFTREVQSSLLFNGGRQRGN